MLDHRKLFEDAKNNVAGINITRHTLVGYNPRSPFPRQHGNCFSMLAADGNEYRILNFNFENLQYALTSGKIEYPINLVMLPLESMKLALIHDIRIPDNWYDDNLCSICTPPQFMPLTYHARSSRELLANNADETAIDINGRSVILRTICIRKPRLTWD